MLNKANCQIPSKGQWYLNLECTQKNSLNSLRTHFKFGKIIYAWEYYSFSSISALFSIVKTIHWRWVSTGSQFICNNLLKVMKCCKMLKISYECIITSIIGITIFNNWKGSESARFSSTYIKVGRIQRQLSWPLCRDDT